MRFTNKFILLLCITGIYGFTSHSILDKIYGFEQENSASLQCESLLKILFHECEKISVKNRLSGILGLMRNIKIIDEKIRLFRKIHGSHNLNYCFKSWRLFRKIHGSHNLNYCFKSWKHHPPVGSATMQKLKTNKKILHSFIQGII